MATVTALMTTYNASRWVGASIASVLSQTYEDFELLIIDDGSTDNTTDVINSFGDARIKLVANSQNKGVGYCLNQALSLVNTPYIAKVDADDISSSTRFQEQINYLEEGGFDLVKCFLSYFPDNEKVRDSARFKQFKAKKEGLLNSVYEPSAIQKTLLDWPCFPHTTYFAKTTSLQKVGYPCLRMFEDYVLFLRLLNAKAKFGCVEKVLVNMRVSDASTTASLSARDLEQGLSLVVEEKWSRLSHCISGKSLFVFGTGQMAKAFARIMVRLGITVKGFVETSPTQDIVTDNGTKTPVISLDNYMAVSQAALVVAAQPVREELTEFLESENLHNGQDFLILA